MSVKVGLTGLWGSGKTTVLKLFEELGAKTLDLDEVVHELLKDEGIKERIRQTFGNEVFTKEGINRKALARRAFSSEQARKSLESILHPEVFKRMMDFLNQVDKVLVVEVPLLYETSSERFFDLTVLVRADENLRKERLLKKGYTLKEIK
ncbi:MAG: dephospho-CoA kinase, partial [Nitrospirae bacterium]